MMNILCKQKECSYYRQLYIYFTTFYYQLLYYGLPKLKLTNTYYPQQYIITHHSTQPQRNHNMTHNQPFNLLTITNNTLILNHEAITKLKQLTGHIYSVCSVGPILTGKSSLLNCMIGKDVFGTGDTTMPKTRGINAYIESLGHGGHGDALWILYLDAQGFDDSFNDTTEEIDHNLFLLSASLCQFVCYNSFGALDSRVFERLASLKGLLPEGMAESGLQVILLQRDFALKLANNEGDILSDEEYLQYCMRNYKDKESLDVIAKIYHGLRCFTVSHPSNRNKYLKNIQALKTHLCNRILSSFISQPSPHLTKTLTSFIYTLQKSIQLLNSKNSLKQLHILSQAQIIEDAKSWLTLYKSEILEASKKEIKENLPMPQELLMFKFKGVQKECLENLGTGGKAEINFIIEAIGRQKVQQTTRKILQNLTNLNKTKIQSFIQTKITQHLQQNPPKQSISHVQISQTLTEITNNLINYYSYVTEFYKDFIKMVFYEQICGILCEKISLNKQLLCQSNAQKEEKQKNYREQEELLKGKMSKYEEKIEALQAQVEIYRKQNNKLKELQKQKNQILKQAQKSMKQYKNAIKQSQTNSQSLLKQLQTGLKQNLMYQKPSPSLEQHLSITPNDKQILTQITKALQALQHQNSITREQQKKQYQMIVLLEKMNKGLRERIEELMAGQSITHVMERKVEELQEELRGKEKFIQVLANEKETVIEKLRTQLRHEKQVVKQLQFELELLRTKAIDKSKTSQFIQKLLEAKQNLIQQARHELLDNLSRYKQEINTLKSQFRERQLELSQTLSMFVLKNEQLLAKNTELTNKSSGLEGRVKRQYQEKLLQKEQQITKLNNSMVEFQTSLAAATESYMQVTNQMEQLIREKQDKIDSLNSELLRMENKNRLAGEKVSTVEQLCEELESKLHKVQLQKQELQSKFKRQQALSANKIKHLSQNLQKLKIQLKQKQSTFEIMLLQLRSHNIINNNNNNSSAMIRESSKKKYNKKIDQIQEIAVKELKEISNMKYGRQKSQTKANSLHTRSEQKNIFFSSGTRTALSDFF